MNLFTQTKRLPAILALAILMIPSGWLKADGPKPDCYVLSAGIDNYKSEKKLSGDLNDARNATMAFAAQKGKMFNMVYARTLLDSQATHANIMKQMHDFARLGKAGDFFVFFFSGHGGNYSNNGGWYFCPYDESPNNTDADLTSAKILNAADVLMKQGKKVVVIVDACFSGNLGTAAQTYLSRYQDPNGGGLILALASSPSQESNALGDYSAFAKAFADGLNGAADANHDGRITLQELKAYTYRRTYQLLRQSNNNAKQDSTILWSRSMSAGSPLALLRSGPVAQPVAARPVTRPFSGN
jgi:uncharacterized caspase-like protein